MPDPFDLYDHPAWYDILFRRGSATTARGLERVARLRYASGRRRLTFVEPACGTGRLLVPLALRAHRVLGYDRNPAMVAYARERLTTAAGPAAARGIVVAKMTAASLQLGEAVADVAFMLDNSIRHLDSRGALQGHLIDTARLLRPGGLYIVGLSFHDPGRAGPDEDSWEGRRGRCRVRQLLQYLPPDAGSRARHEEVIEHIAVERPGGTVHYDARWRLLLVTQRMWDAVVRESPFTWIGTVDSTGHEITSGVFDAQWLLLARRR